jgi:hypothetical protein
MTEAEWLACEDFAAMLGFVQGKASQRKLRLFRCARCRDEWCDLAEECCRAVELAERYADGFGTTAELRAALKEAERIAEEYHHPEDASQTDSDVFRWFASRLTCSALDLEDHDSLANTPTNPPELCHLLRCLHGGLFHPTAVPKPVTERCPVCGGKGWVRQLGRFLPDNCSQCRGSGRVLQPVGWVKSNDGCVLKIAQGIYEERAMPEGTLDTGRLCILHDALLDAGCTEEALLSHCRAPGPHVRGCWAIDLILGKE